jgi:hypothetical protein
VSTAETPSGPTNQPTNVSPTMMVVVAKLLSWLATDMREGVWYAVDPIGDSGADLSSHMLSAQLDVPCALLLEVLLELKLHRGVNKRAAAGGAIATFLNRALTERTPLTSYRVPGVVKSTYDWPRDDAGLIPQFWMFIAPFVEPAHTPRDQTEPGSRTPQPPRSGLRRPGFDPRATFGTYGSSTGSSTGSSSSTPPADPSSSRSSSSTTSNAPTDVLAPPPHMTLRQILSGLNQPTPYVDASGVRIGAAMLDRSFLTGLGGMSATSGGKYELVAAAAIAVHAVLSVLAPDPLLTAAALANPPPRSAADPLRLALTVSTAAEPTGRDRLRILGRSDLALSLVRSYVAATQRKERMAIRAPILAAFTGEYSLRLFNETFELQLGGEEVTRYSWWYAKWHAAIWLAGQAAPPSVSQRWRLEGAGEHGTLPPAKIVDAVKFLTSAEALQREAFGTRRQRWSDRSTLELPAAARTQCKAALWKLYVASRVENLRVSQSQFNELADMTVP